MAYTNGKSGTSYFSHSSSGNTYNGGNYAIGWQEQYDPIANKSIITITSFSVNCGGSGVFYLNGFVNVNGTRVFTTTSTSGYYYWSSWTGSCNFTPSSAFSQTQFTINHNSNGAGSFTIAVSMYGVTTGGATFGMNGNTQTNTITLTSIDRAAPTVSCSASPVSTTSLTVSGTSNVYCDIWEYSLNNGSTWTQFSTTNATSASKTITGLTSQNYTQIKVRARKTSNQVYGTSGAASCDIVAPTITISTSSITANSVYVSASSNVNCNIWQYSKDGGSTWTQFSTSNGASASVTITGLTPNTSYTIKVRARKTSNNLYGTSGGSTIKTLGGTVLNSVSTLTIDASAPVLSLNWTVYDANYTHTLVIKNGSTTVLTVTGLKGSTGTNNKTYDFTAAQRTTILKAMASLASFTATFELTTYSGSTQIGSMSSKTATIRTLSSNSAPTHGGFTRKDNNSATVAVTGSDQLYVQGRSRLRVVFNGGTAKNEASISKYRVTIGSTVVESSSKTVDFGTISLSGKVSMTATVIDSRGWTSSQSVTLTVIDYADIEIKAWTIRRVNEVEDQTQLSFSGSLSEIQVNGAAKNSLQTVRYRYKKTSNTTWSSYVTFTQTEDSGSSFSFTGDFASFDATYSWDIQIVVTDRLTTYTATLFLDKGTPLTSFRERKVGINKVDPQAALDVNGDIMMNGLNVMGYVSDLEADTALNSIKTPGIYHALWANSDTSTSKYPTTTAGILEVIVVGSVVMQRYTSYTAVVYVRVYKPNSWTAWKTVTAT